jgi:hypothetical protein
VALALVVAIGCAGRATRPDEKTGPAAASRPPPCREDQVREYFCDNLVPVDVERPGPDPYATCPGSVAVQGSVFRAAAGLARFDEARTMQNRQRVSPGHSCCYSWCSSLVLADPAEAEPAICQHPNAMRERLCISEAEAGVSAGADAPYERCAAAIKPPASVAFSQPRAAALDLGATSERRGHGIAECCYSWCSVAPLGTGLGQR